MWFDNNVMFVQLQVANVLCAGQVFDEGVEEMNEHRAWVWYKPKQLILILDFPSR